VNYAYAIVILFATRFFVSAVYFPPLDGDLGWQRWLGRFIAERGYIPRSLGSETFTANGAAWTPQEWAFSLAAYAGSSGAAKIAFELIPVACAVGVLLLVAYRSDRRGATPIATACATLLCGVGIDESFGVRAQVIGWIAFAVYLTFLEAPRPKYVAAFVTAAIWSNLHGSAMLACAIAGVFCLAVALEERAWTPASRAALIFALSTPIAISLNPFGIGLPLYAIELFRSPIRMYIQEWRPTNVHELSFLYGDLPMLLGIIGAGIRGARVWFDRLLVLTFVVLVFTAARHMAIFGIALAPIFAKALSDVLAPVMGAEPTARARRLVSIACATVAAIVGVAVSISRVGDMESIKEKMPYAELAAVGTLPGTHNLYCADFAWCSHALARPNERSFLDGRADPFPTSVWHDFASIAYLMPGWRERLDATGTNAVIVASNAALDQALAKTPGWRRISKSKDYALYVRT
jgi:hypothetical protein